MIRIHNDIKIKNVNDVVNDKTPSVSGIVNQECKGKLWIDNIDTPRIAIAESFATGSFSILGNYETEEEFLSLQDFLENDLFIQLKKDGYVCFEFSIDGPSMREKILNMFKDRSIQSEKEYSFRAYRVPQKPQNIPREYQIRKVDRTFWDLLSEGKYKNEDFLKVRLLESWNSFEEFMSKSIAYCTIFDNRIVAVMVGTASYKNVIPIDVETEENHRRKGLAYAMGTEFIADCINNHYILQWDCVESNPNSYQLAVKLGFEKMSENTVYWFDI